MHTTTWSVNIYLSEEDRTTKARAVLHTGTHDREPLQAHSTARRSPEDPEFAEIGEELAAARALRALADELLAVAGKDIRAVNGGKPVTLHS